MDKNHRERRVYPTTDKLVVSGQQCGEKDYEGECKRFESACVTKIMYLLGAERGGQGDQSTPSQLEWV